MPLFRALAKNMAPMTNADESPTNRLTLFPIYLSLFIVSTLWSRLSFQISEFRVHWLQLVETSCDKLAQVFCSAGCAEVDGTSVESCGISSEYQKYDSNIFLSCFPSAQPPPHPQQQKLF